MNYELKKVIDHPLHDDGLEIVIVDTKPGTIESFSEALQIIESAQSTQIVLFSRQCLHQVFMREMRTQMNVRVSSDIEEYMFDRFHRWMPACGEDLEHAMPHRHQYHTCVGAPEVNNCSTGFFSYSSVVKALELLCSDDSLPQAIRLLFATILRLRDQPKQFINDLHLAFSAGECLTMDKNTLLTSIRSIQTRCHELGGMYEVPQNFDGYGAFTVPQTAIHARSLLSSLTRSVNTAWRYF